MTRLRWGLAVLVVVVSACGTPAESRRGADVPDSARTARPALAPGTPTTTTTAGPTFSGMDGPPPFRLRYDNRELVLTPHTWCYSSGCVDGISEDPPSVGDPAQVHVYLPVDGWDLTATFSPAGERCGRLHSVAPDGAGGWYTLQPAGRTGRYDVQLFAQGEGDMVASFQWATPSDGELPTPQARLAVLAQHDGEPDSYGVELMLENLAETPRSVSAEITVTAANGRSLRFDARRADRGCWPEGTVYFDGPDKQGQAAADLGGFPFHYTVEVTIDGTTYRAQADYPKDEIRGNEPSVALDFSPALPALQ